MTVTINVNQLTLVHRGSDGVSRATLPDVCKTPPHGKPVHYQNVSYSRDLADGTATVDADGGNMIAVVGSKFARSTGDELGSLGGVKSGVHLEESTWTSYSMDVKIEGRNACRLTDTKLHNRGNTVNAGGHMQSHLPPPPKCEGWKKGYDGRIIGSKTADPLDPLDCGCTPDGPPVTPPDCQNQSNLPKIVYVNGILGSPQGMCDSLNAIAKKRCASVTGVYNQSDGLLKDLGQCVGDKLGIGDNPANATLQDIISEHVASGEPLDIIAHSQGALITSRALFDVLNQGTAGGVEPDLSSITVETFGGAAYSYPDGPTYIHTVNVFDPVPQLFGRGLAPIAAGVALGHKAGPGGGIAGGVLGAVGGLKDVNLIAHMAIANPHDFIHAYMSEAPQHACLCGKKP